MLEECYLISKVKIFRIVDLPGTYSLSAYSPEEMYVRHHIIDETPDIVINVVDSSNLERNLYLTTQLILQQTWLVAIWRILEPTVNDELEASGKARSLHETECNFWCSLWFLLFRVMAKGMQDFFSRCYRRFNGRCRLPRSERQGTCRRC